MHLRVDLSISSSELRCRCWRRIKRAREAAEARLRTAEADGGGGGGALVRARRAESPAAATDHRVIATAFTARSLQVNLSLPYTSSSKAACLQLGSECAIFLLL
eukprot:6208974-Pleurochrysis_carterae.AAC.2